jgi:hypothetical protein
MTPRTPHAFHAIVAQLTNQGHREATVYDDDDQEWTAFFSEEVDPDGGINGDHECCAYTRCTFAGAWAEDDDGQLYAGNRDELIADLGDIVIKEWEACAEQGANE